MPTKPKNNRGGKKGGGGFSPDRGNYSTAPNPYQIPDNLNDAIGTRGQPMTMTEAYFDANPYYSDNYDDFSSNCQRCVFAYEMRRRGYDVEALPTYENDEMPRGGNWQRAMSGMTVADVGKSTEGATLKAIGDQMKDWGEGSRAILRLKWAGGNSGHVINVEWANGKLNVWDAQSNSRLTGEAYLKKYLHFTTLSRTQLYRTDNATVTDDMRFMVRPNSTGRKPRRIQTALVG